ncbi:helix-turn-helix transcriptional regulator, partial [bacterium]|nr:helix-turn-helix transcriptional regulator [bacterium]
NCRIEFGQPYNRIGFPKDLGSVQISTRDQGLLAVLEKYASEIKQSYSNDQHYVSRTQKLILEMMDPQPPTLEAVAQSLNLSARSLQRKLKQEKGCSYTDLVEDARKKLCAKYLEDPKRTVDEVGYLTGYADTTSFIRAFKRWYGKTPRQVSQ